MCTKQKVTIKTLASLNKHLLMHRKPLKCRFCDVRFTTYASRVLHEDSKHRSNTTFPCDICHKQFSSLRSYQGHRKIHDDPDAFKCKVCDRILSSTYELKLHLHTAQGQEKPRRVSRSAKVLQCADCDRKFVSHVSYHAHRRQHDKRYQCSYCGIRIAQLRDFEDHENIHTGARPYECKTCGKTFRTASTYYGHLLVHGGEKKHVCTICNKGFLRFNHVQVHMRSHTGEKPFRCDTCGRKYADKSAYKRHQLTHRPTIGDMMRAKEMARSIVTSVQDQNYLPLGGLEVNETFEPTLGEQIVQQMDMVFSTAQLLPAEDEGMGVLPSIMSNVLDGQCPIIFEYLSGDSYMTDVPQMITAEDARAISASEQQ
uniref:C2H2-type domain-containing protein n=1 Tax=Anopheles atroparvus TaxID=41427 RepID=A0A182IUR1_ANOAO